jgi:hypothetical protein
VCARSSSKRLQPWWPILKSDNDTTRTQRDALIAFTVRVASAGLLYLSQIVLARWMGRFEYGIRLDLVADARRGSRIWALTWT